MFKGGFYFCMNSISYKRHSNLPLHFLKTVMFSVRSLGIVPCFDMYPHFKLTIDASLKEWGTYSDGMEPTGERWLTREIAKNKHLNRCTFSCATG